jgi:hypothetical protein
VKLHTKQFGTALTKSTMTSDEYKNAVLQAKEHILAGNIFQIVLSQRFERRTYATPFEVYRALRIVNPSPYMAYLQVHIYRFSGYLFLIQNIKHYYWVFCTIDTLYVHWFAFEVLNNVLLYIY